MDQAYESRLQRIRDTEYPSLRDTIYLDHAGTPPVAKSLLERFSTELVSNLYGNPHSNSPSSRAATCRIEKVRHDVLDLFNADPAYFDLVFVANATAGIKLVKDAFRDLDNGFWYGYHVDSHTSLVGVREAAAWGSQCFVSDADVDSWIQESSSTSQEGSSITAAQRNVLFAFPAQSNMNGRRLPQRWPRCLRRANLAQECKRYSLLDAAAFVSTTPLDLSNPEEAADFTVCSFYKIFGFPDLGGLIIRKDSAGVFQTRRYFGGGTVDMVVSVKERWHARKMESVHASLEDGTLPIHNIVALGIAMDVHCDLFGSLSQVSKLTSVLSRALYQSLSSLRHHNGKQLCIFYNNSDSAYGDPSVQGPVVAFNMQTSEGAWIPNSEVEKLASVRSIHIRAGGLCNPGGIASSLKLEPWEIKRNFSAGHRCGNDMDVVSGKPTGMIRVSLGATSMMKDIEDFTSFLREFFVEQVIPSPPPAVSDEALSSSDFFVESITIYPVKSCGGWRIPAGQPWETRPEGLAWDREWCVINKVTGAALSQKNNPEMALLRPSIDLERGELRVRFEGPVHKMLDGIKEVAVPLSADPSYFDHPKKKVPSTVCGEKVHASAYKSPEITNFFSRALGVPCTLSRVTVTGSRNQFRQAKASIQPHQLIGKGDASNRDDSNKTMPPILLSNESPILAISRSSLNRLNEQIKSKGGKAAQAEVFRPNIVVAQESAWSCGIEQPYVEDYWRLLMIGSQHFQVLGSCRRCQMVCIDQQTAERNQEPFVTLSKTRRFNSKVWFGQHICHLPSNTAGRAVSQHPTIAVGDAVKPSYDGEYAQSVLRQVGAIS